MNITASLPTLAQTHPNRPALITSTVLTYRQLDELSAQLAGMLRARGVQAGDRVLLLAPVTPTLYATLIALFRLGATAVLVDRQGGLRQAVRAAAETGAKVFIGARAALGLRWLAPTLRRIPHCLAITDLPKLARRAQPWPAITEVEPETPALITFTGNPNDPAGPRGALHTHRLLAAQHAALTRALPNQAGDVDLPGFAIFTLHNLAAGLPSVLPDFPFHPSAAVKPERVLRQIEQHRVTTASGSPAYWHALATRCQARNTRLPLRRIVISGGPVSPGLIAPLCCVAPCAEILALYGNPEAGPVALIDAREILAETAALTACGAGVPLGRPVMEVQACVLDAEGHPCPPGKSGEIWVSSENVMRAYLGKPSAANGHQDADGRLWYPTGDLGYQDTHGQLWLTGQTHSIIRRQGRTLYPVPVEAAVETLPFVRRAALAGVADPALGERAILAVELQGAHPHDWQVLVRALCLTYHWPIDGCRAVAHLPVDARHQARPDYLKLKQLIQR